MTLQIFSDGVEYENFESIDVFSSFSEPVRTFELTTSVNSQQKFPIKQDSIIQFFADGELIFTGYPEVFDVTESAQNDSIIVRGRSKISRLTDSSIEAISLNPPITLEQVCKVVLDQIGLDLQVVNNVTGLEPFKAEDLVESSDGDNAFTFLEQYARKRQVFITDDAEGNLLITRNNSQNVGQFFSNTGNISNIKRARYRVDNTKIFREYVIKSQKSALGINLSGGEDDADTVANQGGRFIDIDAPNGRKMTVNAEKSMDSDTAKKRAEWQANIARSRAIGFTLLVEGHSQNGAVLKPNTTPKISHRASGFNGQMLIESCRYKLTQRNGNETDLVLVSPDAYLPRPEPDKLNKNTILDNI